jgi:hypothetical protein
MVRINPIHNATSEYCSSEDEINQTIDAGADVIHGHHAHVPQGWEVYKGKPIFYGLGNFIVKNDDWSDNKDQLWSLVVKLDLSCDVLKWKIEPLGNVPVNWQVYIEEANAIFSDMKLMRDKWHDNATAQYQKFYKPFLELSVKYVYYILMRHRLLRLVQQNFSQCENHIDIIKTAKKGRMD